MHLFECHAAADDDVDDDGNHDDVDGDDDDDDDDRSSSSPSLPSSLFPGNKSKFPDRDSSCHVVFGNMRNRVK